LNALANLFLPRCYFMRTIYVMGLFDIAFIEALILWNLA